MPVLSTIGAAAARAYGLFRSLVGGATGYLYIWGNNSYGQAGQNNNQGDVLNSPLQIGSEANTVTPSFGAGANAFFAVKGTGTLWAWGNGSTGQLGDGNTVNRSSPVQIGTLTNWSKVAGYNLGGVAIKTDGTLWAWGSGSNGRLGNNDTANISSPVQIGTLTNWSKTFNGRLTGFAINSSNELYAWGYNGWGQLGNSSTVNTSSPVQISGFWSWINESDNGVMAIKADGTLWSWGRNSAGQLGDGTTVARSSPVQVGTLTNWSSVTSTSGDGSFALIKTNNTLWTVGYNQNGELAQNDVVYRSSPVQVGALTNWSNLFGSSGQVSAIKTDGTLWAWGYNNFGAVGDGTTVRRSSPVQVGYQRYWNVGSGNGAVQATAVLMSSTNGEVSTTGRNDVGQLGDETTVDKSSPVQVGSIVGGFYVNYWPQVIRGASNGSAYAIRHDNTLWAWGRNNHGQLGDGTTITKSSPIQVGTLTNWVRGASYEFQFYGLRTNGSIRSMGLNEWGQLGDGTTTSRSSPVQVTGTATFKYPCGAQNYALATTTNGQLWAWGYNGTGELGTGNTTSRSSPVQVGTLTNWEMPADQPYSTAGAIKKDSTIWTWGGPGEGTLGTSTTVARSSPAQVGSDLWVNISSGSVSGHFLAVKSNGTLWAWGEGTYGQLGNNATTNRSSPVQVGSNSNWVFAAGGRAASYGTDSDKKLYFWGFQTQGRSAGSSAENRSAPIQIGTLTNWVTGNGSLQYAQTFNKTDGSMWTWGWNNYGDLGLNTVTLFAYPTPTRVGSSDKWSQIVNSSLGYAVGALQSDGKMFWWGYNNNGQVGDNSVINRSSPVQIGNAEWAYLGQAQDTSGAIKTNGTLWTWGRADLGTVGDGTSIDRSSPVQIGTLTNWSKLSGGYYNFIATKTDGTLWAWGWNADGQLGNNSSVARSSPIQIGTLTTWTNVASGEATGFALKTDGTLWAWGRNANGNLGTNDTILRSSPVQIASDVASFTATVQGGSYVKTNGTLWSWGVNTYGNIGDNTTTDRSSPVQVGTLSNWKYVSSSGPLVATKTDGTLWSWGYNGFGQIGDGTYINRSSPVQVGTLTSWVGTPGGGGTFPGAWNAAISTT